MKARRLDCAEHADGQVEDGADELKGAFDDDADEAEGQKDEPDEREKNYGCERQGPAKESEKTEEQEVEHRFCSLLKRITFVGGKSSLGG